MFNELKYIVKFVTISTVLTLVPIFIILAISLTFILGSTQ